MNEPEMIDVLDETGVVVDTMSREDAEADNHISANALIFIFDSAGRVWAQLRPEDKKHFPGRWDITACGGLLSGEDPLVGAQRELKEETGLTVELMHVESFLNVFDSGSEEPDFRRMSHLYVGVSDVAPEPNAEVDDFKLWDPADLMEEIEENPEKYVPSFMVELEKALG